MFLCVFVPSSMLRPLGFAALLLDAICIVLFFVFLSTKSPVLSVHAIGFFFTSALLALVRFLWFGVSVCLYLNGKSTGTVLFRVCLLVSLVVIVLSASFLGPSTPATEPLWAIFSLTLLSLLLEDIFMNHTKTSTIPGRRVTVRYWREAESVANEPTGVHPTAAQPPKDIKSAIEALRVSWEKMQADWTSKLLQMELRGNLVSPVFKVIIGLFCNEEESVNRLAAAFNAFPDDVIFFTAQLCIYLLYSPASDLSDSLRTLMLHLCSQDLIFAHRMNYFLRSFVVNGDSVDTRLSHLIQQIHDFGAVAATRTPIDEELCLVQMDHCMSPRLGMTLFDSETIFWDRLIALTRDLAHLRSKEARTSEMQRQLTLWGNELLPCKAIFVPVGNARQR